MYRPDETICEENQSFKTYLYAIGILIFLVILLLIVIINLNVELRRLKASKQNQDEELGEKPLAREKRNYKDKATQVGKNSTTSSSEEEPEFHNKARRFASSSIFPKGQNPFAEETASDTEIDSNFLRTIS